MVFEHKAESPSQCAAMESTTSKIRCTAETLKSWVRQAECDSGRRAGLSSEERERLEALERGNRELYPANEILRKALPVFAQARLDRC